MNRAFSSVVIASSATTSANIAIPPGFVLAGIITPGTLTGTSISLNGQVDPTSASLFPVHNGGTLYSVNIGTNRLIAFDTNVTQPLSLFQLVSNGTEAATRTFIALYVRP